MDAIRATIGTTIRMVAVLAFLIGMPLWALSGTKLSLHFAADEPPAVATVPPDASQETSRAVEVDRSAAEGNVPRPTSDVAAMKIAGRQPLQDSLTPEHPAHARPAVRVELREIQQQLVARGADAMLLELLDTDPVSYRFWCEMPISTSRMYGRKFEAVASDPVSAMRQVLGQVDRWRK